MDENLLCLTIEDITPVEIRAGELALILLSFEDMIISAVQSDHPNLTKDDLGIGLVKLENNSIDLSFTSKLTEVTNPVYKSITQKIREKSFLELPTETLKNIVEIHRISKSHKKNIVFFSQNGRRSSDATIHPDDEIPTHPKLITSTTIFGKLVRVGGSTPKIMIKPSESKTLYCDVRGEDLAKRLGERLYTWVGLYGKASLDSKSLEIIDFRVEGITDYEEKKSIRETFVELSNIAAKYYKDIDDVDKYVANLRR